MDHAQVCGGSPLPKRVIAYTDGGSRGNPGPAAAGIVLTDSKGQTLISQGFYLGKTTNNVAEYTGIIRALEAAQGLKASAIQIFSDSELLVKQLNGQYKVRSANIKPLFDDASSLLAQFKDWKVSHVYRSANKDADAVVNQALDLGQDVVNQSVAAPEERSKTLRMAALISGGGRTILNILEHIDQRKLNAKIPLVISSRSSVSGVERLREAGLNVQIIRKKDYANVQQFSQALEEQLVAAKVDLIIQGGWLCLWKIPARYNNRVMNIHPALLPSFGGQGMWGHHVHEAVLKAGCKVSGCTVHYCTDEYDRGPIIVQRTCPVAADDTPDTLADRVFEQECLAFPQAIGLFAEDRLRVQDGIIKITP
jgi:phosphoribosylglycinamide formyltransferase 1